MRWGVVVPSNRPDRLRTFLEAWRPLFDRHNVRLFVVRDEAPWTGIPGWIPRGTDAIRSWGIAQAHRVGCTHILSLDDDVAPVRLDGAGGAPVDVFAEYGRVFRAGAVVSPWLSVGAWTDTGREMRGFPHADAPRRTVAVQYGGWWGVPDLDGVTQRAHPSADATFAPLVLPVPVGVPLTCCAMNFALRADFALAAWQLPVTNADRHFDRWCDIWSGLIQKRVADACGLAVVVNGAASVRHTRASDTETNIRKEAPGYPVHSGLWEALEVAGINTQSVMGAWLQTTEALAWHVESQGGGQWALRMRRDRDLWAELFS